MDKGKKRGGGPRSRDGREAVAKNAIRHGLTSMKPSLLQWESATQFRELRDALISELAPEGVLEAVMVDRIVWCCWRLRRAARVEQLLLTGTSFDGDGPKLITARWVDDSPAAENAAAEVDPEAEARERERRESEAMASYGRDAGLLTRYERTIEQSLYRALRELALYQAERRARAGQETPSPSGGGW